MRFSLRTLVILMLVAGPLGAWGWREWRAYQGRRAMEAAEVRWRQALMSRTGALQKVRVPSAKEQEIWEQRRDSISWESFPESQPPRGH